MNYGRHKNLTASWMAILALATIAGCHVHHPFKAKHQPAPPPVYMEYPYFGYHPTCWARWPADWIGCPPPEICLPLVDEPPVETVAPPDHDAAPVPPMPPAGDDDALPPMRLDATPDDDVTSPPAPAASRDDAASRALRPSAERMPRSLRMQLRSPSRAATNRGVPSPPRVSLNSYSSSSYEQRRTLGHDYGLARLARQAAVRRSQNAPSGPPSLNELVGAESDDAAEQTPPIKVGAIDMGGIGGS